MNPPIALMQAKHLMFVLPRHVQRKSEILEITRFLTEISVCDYFFVSQNLSTVALAALYSAFDIIGTACITEADKAYFESEVRRLTKLESVTDEVLACMARMKHSFQQSGFTLSTFDSPKGRSEDSGNASPVCVADVKSLDRSD
jgi:lipoyl(octanoyl) transferase